MTTFVGAAGVIGWPVAHSKSPIIHRFWLEKLGLDGDYSRFPVAPERVGQAIRALPALGLKGVNVTVPHKQAVMAHLDSIDAFATAIGAVNTIVVRSDGQLSGTNTDAPGFVEPLPKAQLSGKTAVIVGAGGAARAIIAGLSGIGMRIAALVNRSEARVAELRATLPEAAGLGWSPLDARLPPCDLLVNSSVMGLKGENPYVPDLAPLPPSAIVYDIVYDPLETPLLAAAKARGLRTVDGLAMLIGQAAVAFEYFYGAPAPRQHDAELRARLLA